MKCLSFGKFSPTRTGFPSVAQKKEQNPEQWDPTSYLGVVNWACNNYMGFLPSSREWGVYPECHVPTVIKALRGPRKKLLSFEGPNQQHSLGLITLLAGKFGQNEGYVEKKCKKTGEQKWIDQKNLSGEDILTVLLPYVPMQLGNGIERDSSPL